MASVPVGVLQSHVPHTTDQKHSEETDLGTSTTTTREQNPPLTVTTTEQKGGPAQYPVQALVTTISVTPPIKGMLASVH